MFPDLALVSALATAKPTPIAIVQCTVNRRNAYVDPYQSVTISFVNHGVASADEVRFTVRYASRTEAIEDRGSFEPGTPITHTYHAFRNQLYAGPTPTSCAVDEVHYASPSPAG